MALEDLTTLDAVKAYLAIGDTASDALLSSLITAESVHIAAWLGRVLAAQQFTEVRDGTGQRRMTLRNWPVFSVLSLTIDGVPIPQATAYGTFGYRFDDSTLYLSGGRYGAVAAQAPPLGGGSGVFERGFQNVTVVYEAGFNTPGMIAQGATVAAAAALPADIAQACVELVALRFRERDRIGEKTLALQGISTASYSSTAMPADVAAILNPYRNVTPV